MRGHTYILVLAALLAASSAWSAPNPVIAGAADCGVMRFDGRYYLMGTGTSGAMYVSDDLVRWREPVRAFSMRNDWTTDEAGQDREIHACDLSHHDGLFQLFWSVNYLRGDTDIRAIGHAVADAPTGPYHEPVADHPFDGRIDPHLFVDLDGTPYFYTVKFEDGNVICGQPMADVSTLTGEPVRLLTPIKGTWEWQDHRVNEAPFVIHYRDHYYMLYNANHTGERYGHYAIGCAEAAHPLRFENATKYPDPVLTDNRSDVLSRARALVAPSLETGQPCHYSTGPLDEDWALPDYDDAAWPVGPGAFGNPDHFIPRGTIRTPWREKVIRLRKRFVLDEAPSRYVQVLVNHDDAATIFINGVKAMDAQGVSGGYGAFDLTEEARAALRVGENVLAVECAQIDGPQYIDAGLIDPATAPGESIITNCGQPSLVRGPNGFEWWCVYFAKYNGGRRSQGIDRVHFLGRRLTIDGPTSDRTPGYHPPPALPTFRDLFERDGAPTAAWQTSGKWEISESELKALSLEGRSHALLTAASGTCYLFETTIRQPDGAKDQQAGVIAYQNADGNRLTFGILPGEPAWVIEQSAKGRIVERQTGALPQHPRRGLWRKVRVLRNAGRFEVFVDGLVPEGFEPLDTEWRGPGNVGLYAEKGQAAFGSVTFTLGWDEWGDGVRGWQGDAASGQWKTDEHGLTGTPKDGQMAQVFKGDLLEQYEFAVHLTLGDNAGATAGIFPVYVDDANWLRLAIFPDGKTLDISQMRDGVVTPHESVAIPRRYAPDRHVRIVKRTDCVLVFADGEEALTIPGSWPASRVGLFTEGAPCAFDAISLYHLPQARP